MSVNTLVTTNGVTFFVGIDGTVQTGWQNVGGVLYYFQEDGSMAVNVALTIDGVPYQFDANGIGTAVIVPVLDPAAPVPGQWFLRRKRLYRFHKQTNLLS